MKEMNMALHRLHANFICDLPNEGNLCSFSLFLPFCNDLNISTSDWIRLSVSLFSASIMQVFAGIFVSNSFQFMRNPKWFVLVLRNLKIRLKNTSHLLCIKMILRAVQLCMCVRQAIWQQRNLIHVRLWNSRVVFVVLVIIS